MQRHLTLGLLLTFLPYFAFAQSSLRVGKDYAHFFYVTDFEPGWEALLETAGEVAAIAQELADNYGFSVHTYPNYTKRQILDEITRINALDYGPEDQVLFFFSMHGEYKAASDEGFLIAHDGKSVDQYGDSWISYTELGRRIALNSAQHVLLALDACYSGAFGDRWKGRPDVDPRGQTADCRVKIARTFQYRSRLYFTSGSRKQRTPARSLFAARWLDFLREGAPKGVLTKNELRYHLGTIEYPQPESGTFTNRHEAGGDFLFVHQSACDEPIPDTEHWGTVGTDRYRAKEHLLLYPNCLHRRAAEALIAVPTREPRNPGAPYDLNELPYMVPITGGSFRMGSTNGAGDESPVRSVTLSDYRLGRYEVTVGEYLAFAQATGSHYPVWLEIGNEYHVETGSREYPYREMGYSGTSVSLPIVGVSWYDAVAYCNWLSEQHNYRPVYRIDGEQVTAEWNNDGYRLPTEAEWEFAARDRGGARPWAGTASVENLGSYANFIGTEDGYEYTAPVGTLQSNGLGLHDLSGNVWEWCWDRYGTYASSARNNARGTATGSLRVHRGGSWSSTATDCRSSRRDKWRPDGRDEDIGFRLVRGQ